MRAPRPATSLAAVAVALAVTACSGGEDEPAEVVTTASVEDYYATMREIPDFAAATDAELDGMAVNACDVVSTAVDAGQSAEDAVDAVFRAFVDTGLQEPAALSAAVSLVGANCPVDLSE